MAKVLGDAKKTITAMASGPCSFLIVVSFFTGYVTLHAVPANAHYLAVFRIAGAVAFLAYAGAQWPQSISHGQPSSCSSQLPLQ